jgi:hypothetical protein
MVIGDADGPLLERQLTDVATDAAIAERFLPSRATEHERARIGGVSEEVVHGGIGRPRPAHPPLAGPPARQQLFLSDQHGHHLAGRAVPAPELEHAPDRVTHLLVDGERDLAVLVTIQTDRQGQLQLAARGLVAQAALQPGADQMQLRLAHRALQPQAAAGR